MRETTQDPNLRLGIGEIPFGPLDRYAAVIATPRAGASAQPVSVVMDAGVVIRSASESF
jgi:hypothetical protein